MMSRTRLAAAGGALALGLALAGCAGSNNTTDDTPTAEPTAQLSPVSPTHNDADVAFAQMMIVHHRDAIEMAEMAPERSADPEVLALAGAIAAAQGPEIDVMTGWLQDWGAEVPVDGSPMQPMEHGDVMPGAMSDAQMAQLEASDGEAFDAAFLTLMIGHHQGAIDMAQDEIIDGADPAALDLAQAIATAQAAEITQMEQMLGS
jgi:uncharacterized protein (DUF305 family)